MKRRYRLLGLIIGLTVTALFVLYVMRALHGRDLAVYATPRAFAGIVVAALLCTAGLPLIGVAWRGMLAGLGVIKPWRELTAILGITQFAKYVPGNIAQYLGRAGMSLSRGIPPKAFAITVTLEMLLAVAAALTMGIGAGALSAVGMDLLQRHGAQLAYVAALLAAAAATLFVFLRFAPALLRRVAPRHADVLNSGLLPSHSAILSAFALYLAVYVLLGLGLVVLAHLLLPPQATYDNWLLIASFSLAWIIGFVTPGAPAGLGVREALLLLMLSPVYTSATASVLVIALRLATTLGDVLGLVGGLFILPKARLASKPHTPC